MRELVIPGVVDGILQDPKTYFFWLLGRAEGSNANDFGARLRQLHDMGMPKNPQQGVRQPANAPFFGLTVMIDAGGNARGRIWLPTAAPDANNWYTHEIQVIADAPGGVHGVDFIWAWDDIGARNGQAPYSPINGSVVVTPPPTPPVTPEPPANNDLRAELETVKLNMFTLNEIVSELTKKVEALEKAKPADISGRAVEVSGKVGTADVLRSRQLVWTGKIL